MEEVNFIREKLELKDPKRFELKQRQFQRQFCTIYRARYTALKNDLVSKATEKWKNIQIINVADLAQRDNEEPCIVIGTLYKHQELKPSILSELCDEFQVQFQPARANYASSKDYLLLEDESLSVRIIGNGLNVQEVVTGLVCAVIGYPTNDGLFHVVDHCFPGLYIEDVFQQKGITDPSNSVHNFSGRILLVSGLNFSGTAESLSLNLLAEWLCGFAGDGEVQREQSSITCMIIAGNSIRGSSKIGSHRGYANTKSYDEALLKESAASAEQIDRYLSFIAQTCPVVLMPGEFDPSGHCLPQQPLHPCILPRCARLQSVRCVSNPWIAHLNSRLLCGSSGQAIKDILKVNGLSERSPLTVLEETLKWRHYAPTAPDTVPVYPFEADPFIIREHLDIYFAGDMEKFETKVLEENGRKIRLVCVPNFFSTQTAVVVNLEDLNCWTVSFG